MSKWYLNNFDIFNCEKDEVISKKLTENDEDKIDGLNKVE